MRTLSCIALLAAASSALPSALAATSSVTTVYKNSACTSPPQAMVFVASDTCTASESCTAVTAITDASYSMKQPCTTAPYADAAKTTFGSSSYIVLETYTGSSCATLAAGTAYLADGSCVATVDGTTSSKVSTTSAGAVSVQTYSGSSCAGTATQDSSIPASSVGTCYNRMFKYYTSASASSTTSAAGVSVRDAVSLFGAGATLAAAVATYVL